MAVFMVVGCFQDNMSAFDFLLLGGIGFLGMAMKELNWPRSAFSLGFVLGPSLEQNFFLVYQIHGWQWLSHPIAVGLSMLAVVGLLRKALSWYKQRNRPRALPAPAPDTIFALFLTVSALCIFASASRLPFEAGVFPMLSAGLLFLFTLAVFVQALVRWRRERPRAGLHPEIEADGEWSPTGPLALRANLQLMAMCAVAAVLLLLVGHLAACFAFVTACLVFLRSATLPKALVYATGATLFVYGVFDLLVSRPWPPPLMSGLAL
jgi:hypothetical protein